MRSEVVVFLESFLEFAAHFGYGAGYEIAAPVELFSNVRFPRSTPPLYFERADGRTKRSIS